MSERLRDWILRQIELVKADVAEAECRMDEAQKAVNVSMSEAIEYRNELEELRKMKAYMDELEKKPLLGGACEAARRLD